MMEHQKRTSEKGARIKGNAKKRHNKYNAPRENRHVDDRRK